MRSRRVAKCAVDDLSQLALQRIGGTGQLAASESLYDAKLIAKVEPLCLVDTDPPEGANSGPIVWGNSPQHYTVATSAPSILLVVRGQAGLDLDVPISDLLPTTASLFRSLEFCLQATVPVVTDTVVFLDSHPAIAPQSMMRRRHTPPQRT